MADNQTGAVEPSVKVYLDKIKDPRLQQDCFELLKIMYTITRLEPTLLDNAIIGFGSYHHVDASGHKGERALIGFSPRKQDITIYLASGLHDLEPELAQLGTYKMGKGRLYVRSLGDVNQAVLKRILTKGFKAAQRKKRQAG